MPRKGAVRPRPIIPDPIYNSVLAQRFINRLMVDGKKSISEHIFYGAMTLLEERSGKPALEAFEQAVRNVMPSVEVRARRVGGQSYQVPIEVRQERRIALAIRWLVNNSRRRGGRTMIDKLAGELTDATNNTGTSVKRKEDVHRMAESNKAFAHYRW